MSSTRLDLALGRLHAAARPEALEAMARFGLTGEARLGLAVPTLRALAREFKRDHELALALWDTGIPDAQLLAGMVAEPVVAGQAEAGHRRKRLGAGGGAQAGQRGIQSGAAHETDP